MNPREYRSERQIVPLAHRPSIEFKENVGYIGVVAKEETGAWIHCENPVGVER